jgi:hypothetical protein
LQSLTVPVHIIHPEDELDLILIAGPVTEGSKQLGKVQKVDRLKQTNLRWQEHTADRTAAAAAAVDAAVMEATAEAATSRVPMMLLHLLQTGCLQLAFAASAVLRTSAPAAAKPLPAAATPSPAAAAVR